MPSAVIEARNFYDSGKNCEMVAFFLDDYRNVKPPIKLFSVANIVLRIGLVNLTYCPIMPRMGSPASTDYLRISGAQFYSRCY